MADKYKAPEQSKYGNASMSQRLADGVYMIAANALIKVVMVAQRLSEKLLSLPAQERGEREGEYLSFPDEKVSIPMYELAQKGKIKLFDEQVRQHFGNLAKLFPDYLRERGILPERPVETMTSKVEQEYKEFQDEMAKLNKRELMGHAKEIAERQEIMEYLCRAEIGRDNLGLLLAQERLLDSVYNKMEQVSRPFTKEDIADAVTMVKGEAVRNPKAIQKRLDAFKRELQVVKAVQAEAVELNMQTPEGAFKFAMNMQAFRATVDPDMLARFAETAMLDFPSPDFFGKGNEDLWCTLCEKRFFANLAENFNNHAAQGGNGYNLTITKELKKAPPENEFDGFINRARMARYIVGNTGNPDECLKEIKPYCKACADMIRDVQSLVAEDAAQPDERSFVVTDEAEAEI